MSVATQLTPLGGDFGLASVLVMLLIGGVCGAVGIWILHFGNAILAESFTHALLPGLVVAVMLGASLMLGAVVGVLVAYVMLLIAMRAPHTSDPSAHSITVTTLLALGALLAMGGAEMEEFEHLLFGDPLTATGGDVLGALALAVVLTIALVALHGQLTTLAFDPGGAITLGVPVTLVRAAALALLAIAVAAAANLAGSLLALALVTAPAFGAAALSRRIAGSLFVAAAAGALGGVLGLYVSQLAEWPAGAGITIVLCLWAALAAVVGVRRGTFVGLG